SGPSIDRMAGRSTPTRPRRTEVAPSAAARTVRMGTGTARWVIGATVLGSGIAFLDGTVVNVALPAIARNLDAGVAGLQWTVDSYLITLTSLMLLGGSLGDLYGRRQIGRASCRERV